MGRLAVSCMKGCFLLFNLVFWLSGLALLIVGILSKFAFNYLMKLSTDVNYNFAPYIMIGCGVFIILVGFIGCWAAVKEHAWALKLYMFILIVLFIIEMVGGIAGYILRNKMKSGLEQGLRNAVDQYFSPNPDKDLNTAIDKVQESYVKCCGVNKYTDYFKKSNDTATTVATVTTTTASTTTTTAATTTAATTTEVTNSSIAATNISTVPTITTTEAITTTTAATSTTTAATTSAPVVTQRVPMSCCIKKDGSNCKYKNLYGVPEKDMGIYLDGCYDEMMNKASSSFLVVGGVALGIAVFQILGVICAYVLIKQFKDSNYEKM